MISHKLATKSVAKRKSPAAANSPEPVSQRARAYQGFTQQILNGGILPGQFISQRELMTLLDMPLAAVGGWTDQNRTPARPADCNRGLEADTQRFSGTQHD